MLLLRRTFRFAYLAVIAVMAWYLLMPMLVLPFLK